MVNAEKLTTDQRTEIVSGVFSHRWHTYITCLPRTQGKENGKLIKARGQGGPEQSSVFWTQQGADSWAHNGCGSTQDPYKITPVNILACSGKWFLRVCPLLRSYGQLGLLGKVSQFFLRVWLLIGVHIPMGSPTPKSIWTAQVEVDRWLH